jgi:hypothetical protein
MADTTITEGQMKQILGICKDVQIRIKANGMPELDEDLAEMIELLEGAAGAAELPPDPEVLGREKAPPVIRPIGQHTESRAREVQEEEKHKVKKKAY